MTPSKELSTVVVMTKTEAEAAHRKVGQTLVRAGRDMGGLLLDMHDRQGYKALGCSSFDAYIKKIEEDFGGSRRSVYRWMGLIQVERALHAITGEQVQLPLRHALALSPLVEKPDLLLEAYQQGTGSEVKIKAVVERLMPSKSTTKAQRDEGKAGWTKEDLEGDKELRDALDKIQSIYGKEARMAIQNGVMGMPKSEVLNLAKPYAPTMAKLEHLIFANRWTVAKSLAFLNDMPTDQSTVTDLKNYCLTTKGLYWTGSFNGFDISVKATTAVKRKILMNRSAKHPGSSESLQSEDGC